MIRSLIRRALRLARLAGPSSATRRVERDRRVLIRMARLLYPHPSLNDEVYEESLTPFLRRADREPELASLLRAGVARLDEVEGGDWLVAPRERQVTALERIEGEAFFATVQKAVRHNLYRLPPVWGVIGHDGPPSARVDPPAADDDLDWLPQDPP